MTSIYDQIGGQEALIAVVDDFYVRVLKDADLAPFFAGANMNRLKGRQVEFFAGALGGPEHYVGQNMKEAHRGRGISQADFDRVAVLLAESLTDAGVPPHLVDQILAAVAPLAADIVSGAPLSAG
ncbi:group 1 truncated hemoglobin [Amycolatopsis sp. K13G38]|uniref:Group 1 truncated hemoglobin n=1 Tax=Amycolatopsis acididurans TaxID=2724524 RepID=A0ABX1J5N4_9PSEU|nr:group 1 truncated hemoglobin [Amycolatopsis acididurans]NKQ53602.1 group 1 truncated hemoglobin [Amycolatopsis acididurans]